MLPGKTRSPKMRFCRVAKSGSLIFFDLGSGGGGQKRDDPASSDDFNLLAFGHQSITSPKACRSCLTLAVFMSNKNVILHLALPVNAVSGVARNGGRTKNRAKNRLPFGLVRGKFRRCAMCALFFFFRAFCFLLLCKVSSRKGSRQTQTRRG